MRGRIRFKVAGGPASGAAYPGTARAIGAPVGPGTLPGLGAVVSGPGFPNNQFSPPII